MFTVDVPQDSTWGVVIKLDLVAQPEQINKDMILVYGSADPAPNPGELMLTQLIAKKLGIRWRFFVYQHGKNLGTLQHELVIPEGIFRLEEILPVEVSLRTLAKEIWELRQEPVIVAHLPEQGKDVRKVRATSEGGVPDISLDELHNKGGWLGGNGIHYFLRKYAEVNPEILYICPFQQKGRVYEIYKGVERRLFILTPFVRIAPPPEEAPQGWEPITWGRWCSVSGYQNLAAEWIKWEIENFFRWGRPLRIEIPWEWWRHFSGFSG